MAISADVSRTSYWQVGWPVYLMLVPFLLTSCSAPPDLVGFPVNTPAFYSENKVFYVHSEGADPTKQELVALQHLFKVNPAVRPDDIINHNDPLSVILSGVRIPEDGDFRGTRDIAVVLDIHTGASRGLTSLIVFYQRDVRPGQMLNFNNLLVYADPVWDSATPPYFRLRVLDVKAERNRRTGALMNKISNLSAEIGGMVPHPAIPIVTTAIDVATLVLSNQENISLLDYQIQFYGTQQTNNAGGAPLGPLLAGQWLAVGRGKGETSAFWRRELQLDRVTDQLVDKAHQPPANTAVPYVSMILVKADAEVPKFVLDRSEALLALLSTPAGKSEVDLLDIAKENLANSIDVFTVERRLRKYRIKADLQDVIDKLGQNGTDGNPKLGTHERRTIMLVLNKLTELNFTTEKAWIDWWNTEGSQPEWQFENDPKAKLGFRLTKKTTS